MLVANLKINNDGYGPLGVAAFGMGLRERRWGEVVELEVDKCAEKSVVRLSGSPLPMAGELSLSISKARKAAPYSEGLHV